MTKKERINQLEREVRDLHALVQSLQMQIGAKMLPPTSPPSPPLGSSPWPPNRIIYGSFTTAPQSGYVTPVWT